MKAPQSTAEESAVALAWNTVGFIFTGRKKRNFLS
jgi:hypothetical protein